MHIYIIMSPHIPKVPNMQLTIKDRSLITAIITQTTFLTKNDVKIPCYVH